MTTSLTSLIARCSLLIAVFFPACAGGGCEKDEGIAPTLTPETGSITGVITSAGIDVSNQGVRAAAPRLAPSKPIPIPHAAVRVEGTNLETRSDKNGEFRLDLVPPGDQSLEAEFQTDDGNVHKVVQHIAIVAGNVVDLQQVELQKTGAISGRVTLAEHRDHLGIDVFIPGTSLMAKTARDGTFTILYVPPGTYTLVALRAAYTPFETDEFEVAPEEVRSVDPIYLPLLTDDFPSGNISGTVHDPHDNPVEGATVYTVPDSQVTVTGPDGSYTLVGLFPTKYRVRADKEGYVSNTSPAAVAVGETTTADILIVLRPEKDRDGRDKKNSPPVVGLTCPSSLQAGETATVSAVATDPDSEAVFLGIFQASGGAFGPASEEVACIQEIGTDCKAADWTAPLEPGLFTISISASDGQLSGKGRCEIVVSKPSSTNQCPVVSITGKSEALASDVLSVKATAVDPNGDPLSYNWTATGGMLSSQTGSSVSWTAPTLIPSPLGGEGQGEGESSTYNITVCVSDGQCAPKCAQLSVGVGLPTLPGEPDTPVNKNPSCSISGPNSILVGKTLTLGATVSDPDGDAVSLTWSASGGTLSATTNTPITWTAPNTEGTYTVSCKVEDGKGGRGSSQHGITVTPPPVGNQCPSVSVKGPSSGLTGSIIVVDFTASDPDKAPNPLTASCNVPNGFYPSAKVGGSSAHFEWQASATTGNYTFTCTFTDGSCPVGQSHTVAVSAPSENNPPTVSISCGTTSLNTGQSANCSADGTDPEGNAVTFTWTASGGTLSATAGTSVTWTAPSTEGSYAVTVTASDGEKTASASHSISVSKPNTAPTVSVSGPTSAEVGATVALSASAADSDGDALTCTWGANGGTLSGTSCTGASWTVPSTAGTYTISVTVSDGKAQASASHAILAAATPPPPPPNQPPNVSVGGPSSIWAGGAIDLTCSATDPEGTAVTLAWSVSGGTLSATSGGSTHWTLPNSVGSNTITCTATDADGKTAAANQSVTTTAIPPGGAYECDANTVALYHFDETSGATANDSCGGNHGTISGATINQTGKMGQAYLHNGSAQYVSVSGNPMNNLPVGTFEAWVKVNSFASPYNRTTIFDKTKVYEANYFQINVVSDGAGGGFAGQDRKVFLMFNQSASTGFQSYSNAKLDVATWYHLAVVWNGSSVQLYINGTLDTTVSSTTGIPSTSYANAIGVALDGNSVYGGEPNYFNGLIDEVRISNKARTPDEFNVAREDRTQTLFWTGRTSMPTSRSALAMGEINGTLYALGGVTDGGPTTLSTVEAFDPVANSWSTKASLPTARRDLGAAAVSGILYAVGGTLYDGSSWTTYATVEAYNPVSNSWATKASMPTARCSLGVTAADGLIYAVGGSADCTGTYTGITEVFNPSSNTWASKASMPTPRAGLALGAVNGVVYAVGGSSNGTSGLSTVEAYDPTTNTWTTKTPMPTARWGVAAATVDGILYAIGGATACCVVSTLAVEAYNPATNSWSTKAPLIAARYTPGVVAANGVLYTAGGRSGTSSTATVEAGQFIPELFIPAGKFVMGSDPTDPGAQLSEQPEHVVHLSAYWMDKFEVTNAAYKACVDAAACTAPSSSASQTRASYYGNPVYDNYPVIYVTHSQASSYCSWVGKRLPTEAEWEKSARGSYPDERTYPWGEVSPTCSLANLNGCGGDTSLVGSYPSGASPYGLFEMSGNVWEWVSETYFDPDYYKVSPATNPPGPASPTSWSLSRGAGWNGTWPDQGRTSWRDGGGLGGSNTRSGFRCARNP